jgi:hypothetical protein
MSTAHERLNALEKQERNKLILVWFSVVALFLSLSVLVYLKSQEEWVQEEVLGTMEAIRAAESDISTSYSVRVSLDTGKSIEIDIHNVSQYRQGRRIVIHQSTNTETGSKMYRYLSGSQ